MVGTGGVLATAVSFIRLFRTFQLDHPMLLQGLEGEHGKRKVHTRALVETFQSHVDAFMEILGDAKLDIFQTALVLMRNMRSWE